MKFPTAPNVARRCREKSNANFSSIRGLQEMLLPKTPKPDLVLKEFSIRAACLINIMVILIIDIF
jgi:hypothetical protein